MANPVQAYVSTYVASLGAGQSGWATFSFCNTVGFDAEVPVEFALASAFSFSPTITAWRSTDGGASWESANQGTLLGVFAAPPTQTAQTLRKVVILENGQYLIGVMAGSHQNQSFSVKLGTVRLISAYA